MFPLINLLISKFNTQKGTKKANNLRSVPSNLKQLVGPLPCSAALLCYAAICARPTDVRQLLDNCELPTAQIYHLPFHSCVPAHIQGVFLLHFIRIFPE